MEEARPENAASSFVQRLRQGAIDFRERFRPHWDKRWFRWIATGLGGLILAYALLWLVFARGLPDAATLLNYEPPLPTTGRDTNGQPVHSYHRELGRATGRGRGGQ